MLSDIVFLRKDPPFNMGYVYATYLLEMLEQEGVRVINRPGSVRNANEKLFILQFPEAIADTLVTADSGLIREFLFRHQDIILKPLDGMGGAGIYRLKSNDPNINVIIEQMTHHGVHIMAQRYLPEIKEGDHRVLLLNGKPMSHAVARLAQSGETRANLAAGGRAEVRPLTGRQIELANMIGPACLELGLMIVGLDIIGDYVTEINVTCPTCMRELLDQVGVNYAAELMNVI